MDKFCVESFIEYNLFCEWIGKYKSYKLAICRLIKNSDEFYEIQKDIFKKQNPDFDLPPLQMDFEKEVRKTKVPIIFFDDDDLKFIKWNCPLKFVRKWLKEQNPKFKDYMIYRLFFKY